MKGFSLLRKLEYQKLANVEISGRILDIGGSRESEYHKLIKGKHDIIVANIDESRGADIKLDAEKPFPIESDSFEAVLMFNVLEHLFDYNNAAGESYRILKTGGKLIGVTPFLFPVHEAPSDYFRYTGHALVRIFKKAGFKDIEIKELGSGLFSAVYQLSTGIYRFRLIAFPLLKILPLIDRIFKFIRPNSYITQRHMPLGYFFTAKK